MAYTVSSLLNVLLWRAKMRTAYRRFWRVVPCTSKRMVRTESRTDIEEILKTKLETIEEEPEQDVETCEEKRTSIILQLQVAKNIVKKKMMICSCNKGKKRRCFSLKESYALIMASGFVSSKGNNTIGGLIQC